MTLATPAPATATAAGTVSIIMPSDRNVAACAANESGRYSLALARLTFSEDGRVGYVTCTDSRCMTRAQLKTNVPPASAAETYYLPPSILKRSTGKTQQIVFIRGDHATRPAKGGDTITRLQPAAEVNFPPTENLWPSVDVVAKGTSVTINAELLARMAEAIGEAGALTLTIPANADRPVIVVGHHGVGLLMPIRSEEDHSARYADAIGMQAPNGGA